MAVVTKLVRDPLAFIHNNLLIIGDANISIPRPQDLDAKGRARMTLVDISDGYVFSSNVATQKVKKSFAAKVTGRSSRSKASSVYWIQMAPPNAAKDDVFLSYVCPFRANSALGTTLGPDANLMVTAEMTGCTFGVGSPTRTRASW